MGSTAAEQEPDLLYVAAPPPSASLPPAKHQTNPEELFYLPPPPKIQGFTPTSFRQDETLMEKAKRKCGENPFVPAGALITAGILSVGLYTMKTKNRDLSQKMMRARVAAQGLTVMAIVGGMLWGAEQDD